eukprot:23539-Amorphochlora_amoeboformis.AAC.1
MVNHVVTYDDLPKWRRHNPYIRSGYRYRMPLIQPIRFKSLVGYRVLKGVRIGHSGRRSAMGRVGCESHLACFRSWFYFHNESLNIWSHALGLMTFLAFWGVTYGHTL